MYKDYIIYNSITFGSLYQIGEIANSLQAAQESIKFQKTVSSLDHKLENRPTPNHLLEHNIMKGNQQ